MMSIVMARAHEVGHSGVHDHEFLATGVLAVKDLGDEDAGVRDQVATGLADQREAGLLDRRCNRFGERLWAGRFLVVILDAESATYVERLDRRDPRDA